MKRAVISIGIFVALVWLAVSSFLYIDHNAAELIDKMSDVLSAAEEEDFARAGVLIEDVDKHWDRFNSHRLFIIDTQHIMELTSTIARVKSLIRTEDDDVIVECETAIRLLDLYKDKQAITFYNIL